MSDGDSNHNNNHHNSNSKEERAGPQKLLAGRWTKEEEVSRCPH
jgi:hypothetical protein